MYSFFFFFFGFVGLGFSSLALTLPAIEPDALAQRLGQAAPPRIIDVRATHDFEIAHIPGALNIPLEVLARRTLPPLGAVLVVADGQGAVDPAAAASILRARDGIQADVLEGGFAAWESSQRPSTRRAGLSLESLPAITYQQLLVGKEAAVVLVDLRAPVITAAPSSAQAARQAATNTPTLAGAPDPLANLAGKLHGARLAGDPFAASKNAVSAAALPNGKVTTNAAATTTAAPVGVASGVAPLLVLIDQNDGRAQEVARMLLASGNRRFVILSGGVDAVRLEGHSMIERTGGTINLGGGTTP